MTELKDIRVEIDALDDELAALVARRLKLTDAVAAAKGVSGRPVNDPVREREILTRLSRQVGEDAARGVRTVYAAIFGVSKARQRVRLGAASPFLAGLDEARARAGAALPDMAFVACSGAEGSCTQQAVSRMFAVPTILYFTGFENVFEAVEKGVCAYGVLPVENSSAGSVSAVYDLMQRHRFHIVRSCGLKALEENVADSAYNYTRFICIARDLAIFPNANRVAFMLGLPHRPGALNEVIARFAAVGVNLTKLESRPELGPAFEFRFVFEFEASPANPDVRALLAELSCDPDVERFTFLGAYEET